MADVSHELGALRFVVDSPLSSKVAMFNNHAQQHKQSQLLNPFSSHSDGRASPKPTFSKDEYGKPLAGSLTEMRGQKASMHVMREMLELCQIINSEGYEVKDEPQMRVIPFGELFNIYNYISDKVVGILLRARKHKLVEFEGEMLFQRRDDDVPVFLLKPISEIREELDAKIEDIKRASSPAPQATTVMLDKSAHQQKLIEAGLLAPERENSSKSRTPSPSRPKAATPEPAAALSTVTTEQTSNDAVQRLTVAEANTGITFDTTTASIESPISTSATEITVQDQKPEQLLEVTEAVESTIDTPSNIANATQSICPETRIKQNETSTVAAQVDITSTETKLNEGAIATIPVASATEQREISKTDVNNNVINLNELPTIVLNVSAEYISSASLMKSSANGNNNSDHIIATDTCSVTTNETAE